MGQQQEFAVTPDDRRGPTEATSTAYYNFSIAVWITSGRIRQTRFIHGRLLLYIRGMSGSKGFVNVFPGFNFISFVKNTERTVNLLAAILVLLGIEALSTIVDPPDSELTA